MSINREWITVASAAKLVDRDMSRIYAWVREDRLQARETPDGIILVLSTDVIELEGRMQARKNNRKTRREQILTPTPTAPMI